MTKDNAFKFSGIKHSVEKPCMHKQKGLAAIEFTLILPFLLLLIFACAEIGRMLYHYNALNKAVRDGTRYLSTIVLGGDTGNIVIETEDATKTRNLIKYSQNGATTSLFPNLTDENISISASGDHVVVTVTYQWQPIFSQTLSTFGFASDISLNFPLVSSYTMRALY